MTLAELCAAMALGALVVYALFGGADFGGGVWDLLASGPRRARQRELVEHALAPVWEANHVWLIFAVVVLFTAFPAAYAAIGTSLHIPLTAMLVGIVFRGAAFAFRQYGGAGDEARRLWGRVFAAASLLTPIFLGVIIGALTQGITEGDYLRSWLAPFPFLVGAFALAQFAFLAAVYLTCETDDPALQADFRLRALVAGVATGVCALAAGFAFRHRLMQSSWSWPLQIATGVIALSALAALVVRRFRAARLLAAAQVVFVIGGWGLSQQPLLVAPSLTIAAAAAPARTLELLLVASGAGVVVLVPSLYWLFRVFKR